MQRFISLLFALLPLFTFGADSTGTNHLYIAAMGQYNLNKWNVYNSSEYPNLMQTKNTIGSIVSLGYRRVTKYGLIIMLGVGLCTREHDISIVKNMQDYDPTSLTDDNVNTKLKFKMRSIDPEMMIGYRKAFNKKYELNFKTGVVQKRFLNSYRRREAVTSTYTNSNNTYINRTIYTYETFIGKPIVPNVGLEKIISYTLLPQFSIGTEYKYDLRYIKYISIDLNIIVMKPLFRTHFQEAEVISRNNLNTTTVSKSNYIDRFASIGLRVNMGLWK